MIRFACPGCKRTLSAREEQAGQIVTCPKCGQRMQLPRPASRQSLRGCLLLVGVLLLVGPGSGIWLWMQTPKREPEMSVVAVQLPSPASKPAGETPSVAESKPPEEKSDQTKAPERGASAPRANSQGADALRSGGLSIEPPPLPPVEEPKAIDLADDLPPELPFDLVDAINAHRAKAGVEPIFLDAEVSQACQSRAAKLARRPPPGGMESVALEAPLAAVAKWLQDPKQRAAILEPRLRTFGAGYARNVAGQWVSVFDWTHGLDRGAPLDTTPVAGTIVYPGPGQTRVPLWFPGNETPDPLPQTKDKLAGYPITLTFPPRTRLEDVAAKLSVGPASRAGLGVPLGSRHLPADEESEVSVWLSTPDKPANPQFAAAQQTTICLIAKKPLRPNTRYQVEVSAKVNGAAWSGKWEFLTVSEGEIHQQMAGSFLRTFNRLRRHAGLPPVPLDAERSKACAAHVRYLTRNVPIHLSLNWNEEKSDLPGYTTEGAALARTASIQGGGGPTQAVAGLINSIISRPQLLHPRLHDLGLGYSPFMLGGWLWVIDMHRAPLRSERGEGEDKEYFYPAPDQENVPLNYPPNEVPSPIPAQGKLAGYAITALFGPRVRVTAATAKLVDDKNNDVDGWLSSPEKPAIAGFPQYLLCFLPKAPLRPNTRYTVTFQAEVNGRPWRRTWSFTTMQETDRYADDLDEKILAQVNAARKAAGLAQVHLDAGLSTACQSHARYLALNHQQPAAQGMGVHRQDASLPGATPEGAKAAKESVVAVLVDPQSCVENWLATLYHRIPILRPDLERIGFGHARIPGNKWACVLDAGNGRAPRGRQR